MGREKKGGGRTSTYAANGRLLHREVDGGLNPSVSPRRLSVGRGFPEFPESGRVKDNRIFVHAGIFQTLNQPAELSIEHGQRPEVIRVPFCGSDES